jgi:Mrp family chromosome partitioning ATPase
MIDEARNLADWVIVDSPPLNEVVDALPLTRLADDVLIVVRLGTTRLDKLSQLGELLVENDVRPTGFAVVGTPRPSRGEYHYYAGAQPEGADAENVRQPTPRRGT